MVKRTYIAEGVIQKKVTDFAKKNGCVCRKYANESRRNAPDYIIFFNSRVIMIEFKATGKKPTKGQLREGRIYSMVGIQVFYVDDIDEGKQIIKDFISDAIYI